ncbi:MAG: hypothetical protein KDA61_07065 [Planctomycetales bacterium]|nr:hypothetical protein [Planctomycetales bacterium]
MSVPPSPPDVCGALSELRADLAAAEKSTVQAALRRELQRAAAAANQAADKIAQAQQAAAKLQASRQQAAAKVQANAQAIEQLRAQKAAAPPTAEVPLPPVDPLLAAALRAELIAGFGLTIDDASMHDDAGDLLTGWNLPQ